MLSRLLDLIRPRPRKKGLALLQEKTQKLLWSGLAPDDVRLLLLDDQDLAEFHDYIRSMDADMLGVGQELARKWGAL